MILTYNAAEKNKRKFFNIFQIIKHLHVKNQIL
jgi:hypothetical protein